MRAYLADGKECGRRLQWHDVSRNNSLIQRLSMRSDEWTPKTSHFFVQNVMHSLS